jgi:Lon protease-like protein
MNIVTIGGERFRLRTMRHDLPYLAGNVEPWPLAGAATEEARELAPPVRAFFRQYVSLLAQAQGHKIDIEEVPKEPRTLALLIAIAMQVPMPQKQRLLDQPNVGRMLRAELALMRREQLLLDHIIQTQNDQWEGGSSGLLAKN